MRRFAISLRVLASTMIPLVAIAESDGRPSSGGEPIRRESSPASEQAPAGTRPRPGPVLPQDEWDVGVAVVAGPRYAGASRYQAIVVPLLRYESGSGFFVTPYDGIGFKADSGRFVVGAALRYDFTQRRSDDSPHFSQWESVSGAPATNVFAQWRFGRNWVKVNHQVRLAESGERGGLSGLELGRTAWIAPRARQFLFVGAYVAHMDGDYANTFFSVDAGQASTSGFRQRDADHGLGQAGVFVSHVAKLGESWGLFTKLSVQSLLGDAASAPFTEKDFAGTLLFSLSRRF